MSDISNIGGSMRIKVKTGLILSLVVLGVSGCSTIGQVGNKARSMTKFGSQNSEGSLPVNETLVIPPSLRKPSATSNTKARTKLTVRPSSVARRQPTTGNRLGKSYYIVVGTYPDQNQALDTFVRLSSIGLPGATMESRVTKSGKRLHMVRLGPYQKQEDIDKVKDSLTSDGLSQFKVVSN